MSLDMEVCAHVVRIGTLAPLQEAGVVVEMLEGDGRLAFEGLLDFWKKYRSIPSPAAFQEMTKVDIERIENRGLDATPYYVDKLRDRHAESFIRQGLAKADAEHFQAGDFRQYIDTAAAHLRKAREIWKGDQRVLTFADLNKDRVSAYERAESMGTGVVGIPTPWPLINEATGGLMPSDYMLIVGKRKLGKSWLACGLALSAAEAGARVLVVPMEMPILAFQARMLCMKGMFTPKDVKMGRLYQAKQRWYDFMVEFGDTAGDRMLFVPRKRVSTCDDLMMVVEEHDPDLVLVDGMYLLDKRKYPRMSRVERLEMTSGDFREIALSGDRVIVGTHQFNREQGEDDVEASLDKVGMSDSLTFDPTVVAALTATPGMLKNTHQRVLSLIKNREGEEVRALLRWSYERPDFSETGRYTGEGPRAQGGRSRNRGRDDDTGGMG